jgi:hypothetical protein
MEGTRSYNASFRTGEMIYSRFVMQRIPGDASAAMDGVVADRVELGVPVSG